MPAVREAAAAATTTLNIPQPTAYSSALPPPIMIHRQLEIPAEVQKVVPDCAQSCIATYISQQWGSCASDDYLCLCSQYGSDGFTLGELAYGCVSNQCGQAFEAQDQVAYQICISDLGAVQPTHTTGFSLPVTTTVSSAQTIGTALSSSSTSSSSLTDYTSDATTTSSTTLSTIDTAVSSTPITFMTSLSSMTSALPENTGSPAAGPAATTTRSTLTSAQAVGVTVASFGAAFLIVALIWLIATLRNQRMEQTIRKRDSYDFIDEAPADHDLTESYGHADPRIHFGGFYKQRAEISKPSDEKSKCDYYHNKPTIFPVPLSRESDPSTHDLSPPPKAPGMAMIKSNSPASEHNSLLLLEKPKSIGPPPRPKRDTRLTQAGSMESALMSPATLFEEDRSPVVANFSRPALPGQPKAVYIPSNPRANIDKTRRDQKLAKATPPPPPPLQWSPQQQQSLPREQQLSPYKRSLESARKLNLSLEIPRQANKSVGFGMAAPMQTCPPPPAPLRQSRRSPASPPQMSQQKFTAPPQQPFAPPPLNPFAPPPLTVFPPPPRPRVRPMRSTPHEKSGVSGTENVLSYYTSPEAGSLSPKSATTPIDEDAQRRKAAPLAITVTNSTYAPRTARSSSRLSMGSDTEFEDNDSDGEPTPPGEGNSNKQLSPVQESTLQVSPIAAIRYPKVPRSSNQAVARNPIGGGAAAGMSPMYSPSKMGEKGLAGLIEKSQARKELSTPGQRIDTSMLSGSTLAAKRRGNSAVKNFRIDTSRSQSRGSGKSGTKKEEDGVSSARSLPQRESPLKGYGRVTSARTVHTAPSAYDTSVRPALSPPDPTLSPPFVSPQKQKKVPRALRIGEETMMRTQEIMLPPPVKSPLWEPKLTPSRRGDDLFLSVSLGSPALGPGEGRGMMG